MGVCTVGEPGWERSSIKAKGRLFSRSRHPLLVANPRHIYYFNGGVFAMMSYAVVHVATPVGFLYIL